MRDLLSWSLPLGRLFGITIKVHVFFPVLAIGLILKVAYDKDLPPGIWGDAAMLMGLLFGTVLLHELGHCAGGRYVEGDAHEILLWPLGGLAFVDVPHTPRANLITALSGPAMNLLICLVAGLALGLLSPHLSPPWNPLWYPYRTDATGVIKLNAWDGSGPVDAAIYQIVLARLFWISWVLFLVNMLIMGFPMDGGRVVQSLLWYWYGYRQATVAAVWLGFVFALILAVVSIAIKDNNVLVFALALFIGYNCHRQWVLLETGGEDSPFGYDFSQGYTSLERDQPPPPRRRQPNVWQRWWQRRAQRKQQRQEEQKELEDRRMDELLEKVQRLGLHALTDEERRFMARVSAKYRNRQ